MFETPPYIVCPKCGDKAFGIVFIKGNCYYRRCRACKFPGPELWTAAFPLPIIKKKVIYLDQFVYSNFAKIDLCKECKQQKVYKEIYAKVLRLYNLQAIVCPYSDSHDDESALSKINTELKKEYQKFSGGLQFEDYLNIETNQLIALSSLWIKREEAKGFAFDKNEVIDGEINSWNDKIQVSINRTWPVDWVDSDRKTKSTLQEMINALYSKYKDYQDDPFEECYSDEKMAYGKNTITIFMEYVKGNPLFLKEESIIPPDPVRIVMALHKHFCCCGIHESQSLFKVFEFLLSDAVSDLPFIKIPALIYASIAKKIRNGMRQPIDAGTPEDAKIISHLVPYCDAMFIDNRMHSLLQENPVKDRIGFATNLFSLNTSSRFLEYLDSIENDLSAEQISHAEMLYWPQ